MKKKAMKSKARERVKREEKEGKAGGKVRK
jgi:hypothetical protein